MQIAVVSAYPPHREAFAEDARELVQALAGQCGVVVCAVGRPGLNYPDEVVVAVSQEDEADYPRAARVLAEYGVAAALIRYDDGVYGGPHGAHVVVLARELRRHGIARIVSLDSVRRDAPSDWARTVAALTFGADRVLVPTSAARTLAVARRIATPDQVRVAEIGVPAAVVAAAGRERAAEVRTTLLAEALREVGPTLTTIDPDGWAEFESTLAAVRRLADQRPALRYVVVRPGQPPMGAEPDRRLVEAYSLVEQVRIVGGHLPTNDLVALLSRTNVYVAVGDDAVGLPRALAVGCATLAVPLGARAGPSTEGLAGALAAALDDPSPGASQSAAVQVGHRLGWPAVARRHAVLLSEAVPAAPAPLSLPPIRLGWLDRDVGRLRSFDPDRSARLAAVAADLLQLPEPPGPIRRAAAAWVSRAVRAMGLAIAVGLSPPDSARAVWGLGRVAAAAAVPERPRERAAELRKTLAVIDSPDLTAAADIVLGLAQAAQISDSEVDALRRSAQLIDAARRRRSDWPIFAERFRCADIRVAHALLVAGRRLGDVGLVQRAVEGIEWLGRRSGLTTTADGTWHPPMAGAHLSVDAGAFVEALAEAHVVTGEAMFGRMAQQAMCWFLGANAVAEAVLEEDRGGCHIGLGPSTALTQSSAVATLAYLGAALSLKAADLAVLPVVEVFPRELATVA